MVPTATPNQATALAVGGLHACAVVGGGAIRCWGDNANGQLGDGTLANPALPDTMSVPVSVSGVTGATAVAVGDSHSCALLAGGTVRCWGANGFHQLGNGGDADSPTPVAVAGHHRAPPPSPRTPRTRARWWQAGRSGAGAPTATGSSATAPRPSARAPVTVTGITGATSVAAGGSHTCAVVAGTVRCWGSNAFGRLGNGTTTDSLTPVTVTGITNAVAGHGRRPAHLRPPHRRRGPLLGAEPERSARERHHHERVDPGGGRRHHQRHRGGRRRAEHLRSTGQRAA